VNQRIPAERWRFTRRWLGLPAHGHIVYCDRKQGQPRRIGFAQLAAPSTVRAGLKSGFSGGSDCWV